MEKNKEECHKKLKEMFFNDIKNFIYGILLGQILMYRFYKSKLDIDSLPSFFEIWIQIFIFIFFEDFFFYWIHRFLNLPVIYKYIHKKHHNYYNLIYLNVVDTHPLEFLLGNFFTTIT